MFSLALQAVNGLTAGVALLTQLLEATVLLMLLDKLAAAIRFTYQAGRFTGRLWYQYGVPAVLWLADTVSWLLAQIDWAAVLQTVVRTGCAAVAAFQVVRSRWIAWHDVTPAPALVAPPAVNPLYVEAAAMEAAYSVRTLQATVGVRKARTKHHQIAAFIAR